MSCEHDLPGAWTVDIGHVRGCRKCGRVFISDLGEWLPAQLDGEQE